MSVQFSIATAFSNTISGGNPALVVLDSIELPDSKCKEIATLFQQPITAYLGAPQFKEGEKRMVVAIRWFASKGMETFLCGHGTLASLKVLMEQGQIPLGVEEVEFQNHGVPRIIAKLLSDGKIQINIPAVPPTLITGEEAEKLGAVIEAAFGRKVNIRNMGNGGKELPEYLLIELDEEETLEGEILNLPPLLKSGYGVHIFAQSLKRRSEQDQGPLFSSRMFSPVAIAGPGEDHVCGSAHALLAPYFMEKHGIAAKNVVEAIQVSPRGGKLGVAWDKEKGKVELIGEAKILSKGEIMV